MFFLVALACSALVEFVANVVKKRSKYLLRGLRDLLDTPSPANPPGSAATSPSPTSRRKAENGLYDKALEAQPSKIEPSQRQPPTASTDLVGPTEVPMTLAVMGHPLVRPFMQSGVTGAQNRNPSYLPAKTFAAALVDLLVPNAQGKTTIDDIRAAVVALNPSIPFRGALLALLNTAATDVNAFTTSVEQWYDNAMDRISGSYKRWAKRWIIVIALVVAIALQIDTIQVASSLYSDGPLREAVVAEATNHTLCPQGESVEKTRACVDTELAKLQTTAGLPVGWSSMTTPGDAYGWLLKLLGWGLTALAASFGAPFWFEALSKLGSLRNTGAKPAPTT
ncbi:MAG: hypothetical protein ABI890_02285 [Lapillicoccus sp.]